MSGNTREMISCARCRFVGPVLMAHVGYRWYYFLVALTGVGVIPLAVVLILLGNRTVRTCPACGSEHGLVPANEPLGLGAAEVWERAAQEDERRFKRNKYLTALFVMLLMMGTFLVVFLCCDV